MVPFPCFFIDITVFLILFKASPISPEVTTCEDILRTTLVRTTDNGSVSIAHTQKGRETLAQAEPVAEEITGRIMVKMGRINHGSIVKSSCRLLQNANDVMNYLSRVS